MVAMVVMVVMVVVVVVKGDINDTRRLMGCECALSFLVLGL
jgi:hypothetical protein